LAQYARFDQKPYFLIESRYENERRDADGISEQRLRTQAYQALLSGAMGQVFGNAPIWYFNAKGLFPEIRLTWQHELNGRGSQSMTHLGSLFAAYSWWKLEPDASNATLTAGLGSGRDRAVAARAADGSFAIAYMPSVRTVTVNLAQLAGPQVNIRWYDPANGTYATAEGSPLRASGPQTFRPPGKNSSKFGDWALIIESTQ
jgi:hypothetical protein